MKESSLNNLYHSFWKDNFINAFAFAILLSLLFGFAKHSLDTSTSENTVRAGDFAAFYAAGELARTQPNQLYNLESQATVQKLSFREDGYHVFAYPPFVALLYEPLSLLAPYKAKVTYVVILLFASILSAKILLEKYQIPISYKQLLMLLFAFTPFTIGVFAGQNTAISLLLLTLVLKFLEERNWLLLGICTALWNFKPQYSAICFLILIITTKFNLRFFLGFLLVSLVQMISSIWLYGLAVIPSWLNLLTKLGEMNSNSATNVSKMTSLLSLYRALSNQSSLLGTMIIGGAIISLLVLLRRHYRNPTFIGPAIVLISPQTGFYDLALILPFVLNLLGKSKSEFVWKYLALCLFTYLTLSLQVELHAQILPLFVLTSLLLLPLKSEVQSFKGPAVQ